MWIIRGLESYPPDGAPVVVALGTFDGVHLAHRAVLSTAVSRGRDLGLPAIACTFDPRPTEVLQPARAPLAITTLEERLDLMGATGLDGSVVLRFTPELATVEPETFVKDVLLERVKAREVVVGYNHTFGRRARGDARLLTELAGRFGFRAHVAPPYEVDGLPVSSSGVRGALQAGDVERASRFLGRPYAVLGEVVPGAGRGRSLGFPTANLQPDRPLLVRSGVYACRVELEGVSRDAVVNVGTRPTFGEDSLAVEAHLLDFSADLYGKRLRIGFVRRLREEMRFPSVEALRQQIEADVENARRGQE